MGLDHTRHFGATMWFSGGSSVEMRTLEPDDERGLCYLYPSGGSWNDGERNNQ